uniref:Ripply transcriptional repressor 2 n=2 Tax=Neoaves TaxID=3078114 RepID=A0A8C3KHV6_9CHAR
MEGGGTGCGCPRPPPAALPPQGYSPLFSSSSSSSSLRCRSLPGPAIALLPSPRRSAPFWRPWVPAPGEGDRRNGPGPGTAAVSGARRRGGGWPSSPPPTSRYPPRAGLPNRRAHLLLSPPQPHEASRKLAQYTHPVRLFWPKSRCYDYLYQEAEALLKNFPVQATISFYEDSDSEDDEDELEQDSRTESDC